MENRRKISSLINSIMMGGIAGIFFDASPSQIIVVSAMFGGIAKPVFNKYLHKTDWNESKQLIPYYMIGSAFGLAFTQFIKYNL